MLSESIESAIRADIAEQHRNGLTGAATTHAHWASPAAAARVMPGPPTECALVTAPGTVSNEERNLRVARRMASRRLTIVGGLAKETVYRTLKSDFGLDVADVRWIETERSRCAPLEALKGMRPEADVVFCVTSWIGHSEAERVVDYARKRGVTCIRVERRSEIAERLREELGH